jgi:hypothetical protein
MAGESTRRKPVKQKDWILLMIAVDGESGRACAWLDLLILASQACRELPDRSGALTGPSVSRAPFPSHAAYALFTPHLVLVRNSGHAREGGHGDASTLTALPSLLPLPPLTSTSLDLHWSTLSSNLAFCSAPSLSGRRVCLVLVPSQLQTVRSPAFGDQTPSLLSTHPTFCRSLAVRRSFALFSSRVLPPSTPPLSFPPFALCTCSLMLLLLPSFPPTPPPVLLPAMLCPSTIQARLASSPRRMQSGHLRSSLMDMDA